MSIIPIRSTAFTHSLYFGVLEMALERDIVLDKRGFQTARCVKIEEVVLNETARSSQSMFIWNFNFNLTSFPTVICWKSIIYHAICMLGFLLVFVDEKIIKCPELRAVSCKLVRMLTHQKRIRTDNKPYASFSIGCCVYRNNKLSRAARSFVSVRAHAQPPEKDAHRQRAAWEIFYWLLCLQK